MQLVAHVQTGDSHTFVFQSTGISAAFITEGVTAHGDDQRGRRAGQAG